MKTMVFSDNTGKIGKIGSRATLYEGYGIFTR